MKKLLFTKCGNHDQNLTHTKAIQTEKKFPKKQTQNISPFWDVSMVAVIFSLILLAVVSDVTLMFPVKFCYENS